MKKNYLALFAKSFNWAGFFLPRKIYDDCTSLYAFCRVLDDIADEKNNLDTKIEKFNKLKKFFKISFDLDNNDRRSSYENEKIILDIITLAENNKIKKIVIEDLIDGVASDLKKRIHIRLVKDLLVYSYRVAGTVGLMMSRILNVNDRRALKGAIDLGIAMQLTNIARDVVEDKKMNREYIKPDFENIQATLKLAEMFYDSSFSSIQKIPFRYKFSIIVAEEFTDKLEEKFYKKVIWKIIQNQEKYMSIILKKLIKQLFPYLI